MSDTDEYTIERFHYSFYEFLKYENFKGVRVRKGISDIEVVYGNFGVMVSEENKISMRDYSTYRVSPSLLHEPDIKDFINEETIKLIHSVNSTFGIETNLGFILEQGK